MTDPGPGSPLEERVGELETVVKWLINEMGLLSGRVTDATTVEAIIRRARQGG